MKKYDIVTIGGATEDITFYTDELMVIDNPKKDPLRKKLAAFEYGAKIPVRDIFVGRGGGATNSASTFSSLGLKTATVLRVGNDKEGRAVVADLKSKGIGTKFIQVDKKMPTAFSFIVASQTGKDHTIFAYRGCSVELGIKNKKLGKIKTNWFYMTSIGKKNAISILNAVFAKAKKDKIKIAWNIGSPQLALGYKKLAKYIKQTEVLQLNNDEATELVLSYNKKAKTDIKNLLKTLKSFGPQVVVVTEGPRGAHVFDGQKIYASRPWKKEKIDTTGVGDAFGSGFVSGLIIYSDIKKALKLGTINAGSVALKIGAHNGILKKNQLKKLI